MPLVRRIYRPAMPLPPRDRHEPDGWLIAGVSEGPVEEVIGPQLITGGWWRAEVARAYYYVRTRNGRWFWIYHDLKRRRWFLQGEVQ
jgi:protein ImuB